MIDRATVERIILMEVLGLRKPERAGSHCRELARAAAVKILAAAETPDADHTPHRFEDAGGDTCRFCGNRGAHLVHERT